MGAFTDHKNTLQRDSLSHWWDELFYEYDGFVSGILYEWFMTDPDHRDGVDCADLERELVPKIKDIVKHYDYCHEKRKQFQALLRMLTHFEVTRKLKGDDFQDALVDAYECTTKQLAKTMSVAFVVDNVKVKPKSDRELYRLVTVEGLSKDAVAKAKRTTVQKISDVIKKLDAKVEEYATQLLTTSEWKL